MQERYRNIETDVVFRDEGYFDVTHDTDTTFGLRLGTLMSAVAKKHPMGGGKIWLDIKNLSAHNASRMLSELESLCAKHNLTPDRLIIESPD